jgi:hypothetical protein
MAHLKPPFRLRPLGGKAHQRDSNQSEYAHYTVSRTLGGCRFFDATTFAQGANGGKQHPFWLKTKVVSESETGTRS